MADITQDITRLKAWQTQMIPFLEGLETPPPPTGGMPAHRMGVHLIRNREDDLLYIERLRPASVKIVDPDPEVIRRVLRAIDPNGVVVLRDHPLSEQKADMTRDPTGTGRRHAQDWIAKLTTGRFKEFGGDKRIVVIGINEPDVHNEAEERIVLAYTLAFLQDLTAAGIRGGALNLSVGWPRSSSSLPGAPAYWDTFRSLENVILRNNGFLITHEYWHPTVQSGWGFYGNRIKHCPFAVPIIIGECAYTKQLISPPVGQPWGWRGAMTAPAYAESLWWYHDNVDVNVHSIMPFTTGFGGAEWESKDTQPAHADILARKHGYSWPAVWPVKKDEEVPPVTDKDLIIYPRWKDHITGFFGSLYTNKTSGAKYAHEGLDISMPIGQELYCPMDGTIAYTGYEPTTYGHYIRVSTELSVDFFFGHLSEVYVNSYDVVTQGQLIGRSGNSGNSSGPHEHFEVRLKVLDSTVYQPGVSAFANARVDPIAFAAGWIAMGGKVEER